MENSGSRVEFTTPHFLSITGMRDREISPFSWMLLGFCRPSIRYLGVRLYHCVVSLRFFSSYQVRVILPSLISIDYPRGFVIMSECHCAGIPHIIVNFNYCHILPPHTRFIMISSWGTEARNLLERRETTKLMASGQIEIFYNEADKELARSRIPEVAGPVGKVPAQ